MLERIPVRKILFQVSPSYNLVTSTIHHINLAKPEYQGMPHCLVKLQYHTEPFYKLPPDPIIIMQGVSTIWKVFSRSLLVLPLVYMACSPQLFTLDLAELLSLSF